ncbi:MAG: mechanosensitive ion channel [Parcubacteria group bacterium]|nr:mechanosensitive ion channel [Parcubacteria group bacterium]
MAFDFVLFNNTPVRIIIILAVFWFLKSMVRPIARQLIHISKSKPKLIQEKRIKTTVGFINSIASIILWLITLITILAQFNVDIKTLLAGAGVFGVAFGLAFQSTIKNFITSFGLFWGGYYEVGDTVTIAAVKGVVQEINLKNTILEDEGGIIHYVPNSEIKVITNHSKK